MVRFMVWPLLFEIRVVSGEVGDVLVGQAAGDGVHRGMAARAFLVLVEGRFDVLGVLASNLGYVVQLGNVAL